MRVNLLAISIGNSRTRVGQFIEGVLTHTWIFDNKEVDKLGEVLGEAYEPLREREDAMVVLASVNPPLTAHVTGLVHKRTGVKPQRVEVELRIPIGRQLDPETIVGEDRLLNAAAAYAVAKQACVVVDAGTAITIDFVDGGGTFHGGAIAPGARLMLRSLHEHTAQLPEVELQRPTEAIGHNTAQAMRSAVYHGVRGMVRELTERYAEHVGHFPLVIATGGDAELLLSDYDLIDRIVPDLTLMGIARTLAAHLDGDGDAAAEG